MQDKRKTNINQNLLVKFGNILHFVIKTEKVLPKKQDFFIFYDSAACGSLLLIARVGAFSFISL